MLKDRGSSKAILEDYQGSIADFTKAIELDPDGVLAYLDRGVSKENLGDLVGACEDWKKVAALGYTEAAQWVANKCN